jgi:hypothetical protein
VADPASNPGRAPWREWTLVHLLRRQAEQGDRPFVRFEDGQAFTFRQLDAWTDALAGSLAALGVRAGDRVLGLVGNRAEAIGMLFATVKLGAVWVPVNTGLRGAFLEHQLSQRRAPRRRPGGPPGREPPRRRGRPGGARGPGHRRRSGHADAGVPGYGPASDVPRAARAPGAGRL